uniref:TLC domain-containing protein n=1 Tax=Octactis speculum TaxID=3111310 RepID=A0A7S2BEH0_9STRA|mmetsp:Transcript_22326/g.30477  ORF Transcript_22326/g.30477 Transcript_22326/m.30477 type:complete len:263 (+) Transcript_22326:29-817(+)
MAVILRSLFDMITEQPTFAIGVLSETTLALVSAFIVSPCLYPKDYPRAKKFLWTTTVTGLFASIMVSIYAIPGMIEVLQASEVDSLLLAKMNDSLWAALGFSLGHFLFDGTVMVIFKQEFDKAMNSSLYNQMMVHHVLPLLMWPVACASNELVPLVAYFMVTEVTNVILNFRWILQEMKATGLFKLLIDAGFLISYFVVRIVPIPFIFYLAYVTDWGTYYAHTDALRLFFGIFCIVPVLLNLFWFNLVLKGAMKTLKGKKTK